MYNACLTTYHTESADTNADRPLEKRLFTKRSENKLHKVLVSLYSEIQFSEGITGNKDFRKEDAFCMPRKFILYN